MEKKEEKRDFLDELQDFWSALELKSQPELETFKRTIEAHKVLLDKEGRRLTRKDLIESLIKEYQLQLERIQETMQAMRLFQDFIFYERPPESAILIQGRIVDNKHLGIERYNGKQLYVSLRDKDMSEIGELSKSNSIGYYHFQLSEEDLEMLKGKKIDELYLVVVDDEGKILGEFQSVPISDISKIKLGSRIYKDIEWTYRGSDDPGIALIEGASLVCDILAFYQSLIVNEAQLRTEGLRESYSQMMKSEGAGSIDTYPDILIPYRSIVVTGVSSEFKGEYLITGVTHSITDSGYTQSFTLKGSHFEGALDQFIPHTLCKSCGHKNLQKDRYCRNCGAQLR